MLPSAPQPTVRTASPDGAATHAPWHRMPMIAAVMYAVGMVTISYELLLRAAG